MTALREGLAPVADRSIGFTVAARDVRGRIVRLDTALNAVLTAHAYPPPLARLLAEALTVTALLGATLRPGKGTGEGQLTLQAQARGGAIDLLVCDYRAGEVRGYLSFDGDATYDAGMSLQELFGEGHLAITLDQSASEERYQGIVPLEGATISEAIEGYFANSEQLPTLIRLGVGGSAESGWIAGGMLIQHLARMEVGGERLDVAQLHPDWQHVSVLAATTTEAELADPLLLPETLLWRLFHDEEVRISEGVTPSRGCRCNFAHIRSVLESFPESERIEMRDDAGNINVDCKFCSRVFAVPA